MTLEPQFRHDYTVWRSMDTAPKNLTHVRLLLLDGKIIEDAHWACDLSGEEQPPFCGWFIACGNGYQQVEEPKAYAPLETQEPHLP